MQKIIKSKVKKIQSILPMKIRFISLSLFLFMMGWGLGTDTYFSLYIKDIIGNSWGITAIGTILAISKLALVIPIGKLNDHENVKNILLIGKILYVFCGISFFIAGIIHSRLWLLIATILNGFANATTFTTYRSYYGKVATKSDNTQVFGAYFSATYIAEVIGSLIAAILVKYLDLPYMYLFVVIFALVSLIQDQKIKSIISYHYNKTWKNFYNKEKKSERKYKLQIKEVQEQKFFGEKGFLRIFINECLSRESRQEIYVTLRKYPRNTYIALFSMTLTNFLNYIGFLFIPIAAAQNNLSMSQIAIVFAVMKAPYIVNVFIGKFGDKYSKKILISGILIIMSFLYIAMGFIHSFGMILLLTFGISLGIAMLNPLTSALVSSYTHPKDTGAMSGVQDFACKIGDISGVLGFGILSSLIGLSYGFIIVGLSTFGLSGYLFISKLISNYNKKQRHEIKEEEQAYRLPVPIVDVKIDSSKD